MLDVTLNGEVSKILDSFEQALTANDIDAVLEHFVDECFWRDLVSFTWNIKTMESKEDIRGMLQAQLSSVSPSDWSIVEGEIATEEGGDRKSVV